MVTELKKKEIQTVKEMVDLFTAKISDFKNDMDYIDEKYRKLMEEEKSELKKNLADCKSQLKIWKKMFDSFDSTLVAEAVGEYVSTSTEDVVSVDEGPEFDSAGFTDADNYVEDAPVEVEETEEKIEDTIFSDNNEEDSEESSEEKTETETVEEPVVEVDEDVPVEDDGWPEFPEEWK